MSSITAKVGSYGVLKGSSTDNVAEFRGVPYASIPARWRRSIKLDKLPSSTEFDATQYGPMATQRRVGESPEFNVFGPHYAAIQEEDKKRVMSELDCLNLNIVAPKDAIGSDKKLPVMLWIHGGGFEVGAGNEGLYNGVNLVKEGIKLNEPVIFVSINYRLNLFGFIASTELEKDNASHGGGVGNYGLYDQRVAMEWVRDNISHFGGDGSNVTIFGESAGGASVHAHIIAGKSVFARGIMQSGALADALGVATVSGIRSQGDFDSLVKIFGLENKDDQGKVDGLRQISTEKILEAISIISGPAMLLGTPVDDSHLPGAFFEKGLAETKRWTVNPDAKFIKAVIIGDMQNESAMFLQNIMKMTPSSALAIVQPNLPEPVLQHYGLSRTQTANVTKIGEILPGLGAFLNDFLFASPSNRAAQALTKAGTKVYTYCFDRTNTFPSPLNGLAHHALDLIYVFGNFEHAFGEKKDVELSHAIMKKWIDFANGKEPWDSFATGKALQITTDGDLAVKSFKDIPSRRWDAFPDLEKHWDSVKKYGDVLNSAKPDPLV